MKDVLRGALSLLLCLLMVFSLFPVSAFAGDALPEEADGSPFPEEAAEEAPESPVEAEAEPPAEESAAPAAENLEFAASFDPESIYLASGETKQVTVSVSGADSTANLAYAWTKLDESGETALDAETTDTITVTGNGEPVMYLCLVTDTVSGSTADAILAVIPVLGQMEEESTSSVHFQAAEFAYKFVPKQSDSYCFFTTDDLASKVTLGIKDEAYASVALNGNPTLQPASIISAQLEAGKVYYIDFITYPGTDITASFGIFRGTSAWYVEDGEVVEIEVQEKKSVLLQAPVVVYSEAAANLTYTWKSPDGTELGTTSDPKYTVTDAYQYPDQDYSCVVSDGSTTKTVWFHIATVIPAQKANSITVQNFNKVASTGAQTFSLNAKNAGSMAMTYRSSDGSVKVASNGNVTLPANFVGTVKITVTTAETTAYTAASKTATITVVPAGVKLSSAKNQSGKKVLVKWKKNAKADGYEVQYSLKKTFASPKTKTVKKAKTTSLTIKKLKKGKTYYVRVRTYKTVNKVKYYSSWSNVKKVKIKK